jgi:organic radical activating enzyme
LAKQFIVNEIYRTIHGEGVRYGIPHIFVRFSHCNLVCNFCDTEFESGRDLTGDEIVAECERLAAVREEQPAATFASSSGYWQMPTGAKAPVDNGPARGPIRDVLLCGGEPLLQANGELIDQFHDAGWKVCCETNGTVPAPDSIDWITCSPKVAEHAIKLQRANELKYVRGYGQGIPRPRLAAEHYLISPMFSASHTDKETLDWCINLVLENPQWRLTVQHHKLNFGNLR